MRILVIGELNPDLILRGYDQFPTLGKEVLVEDLILTLGSASAICAAGLARLGNEVSFLGKVGRDAWGDFCIDALAERGVDTSLIIRDPALKTGLTASITSARDRALVTYLGAISSLRTADIHLDILTRFQHLHGSSYYLQPKLQDGLRELHAAAHERGLTTSLDPGFDPSETWGRELIRTLEEVDLFLPNEVELSALTGSSDPVEALRSIRNGRTLTVLKLGLAGSVALQGDTPVRVPAIPVQPVDTTGAGDSFNAGFIHAWKRGAPLREAMRFGSVCGGFSTLGLGGVAAQPTEAQVMDYLREHRTGDQPREEERT